MNRLSYCLLLLLPLSVHAQDSTTVIGSAEQNAVNSYYTFTGLKPALYNGLQHYGYRPAIIGFAYFPSKEWAAGSVNYDNLLYQDMQLMYDAYADKLVVKHIYGVAFSPLTEKISQFSIGNTKFLRLTKNDGLPAERFYEVKVDGPVQLLVARVKILTEKIVDNAVEQSFITKDKFYVHRYGKYEHITSQSELLDILADRRKEVSQYIKSSGLKFRKEQELVLTGAIQYYNQISR